MPFVCRVVRQGNGVIWEAGLGSKRVACGGSCKSSRAGSREGALFGLGGRRWRSRCRWRRGLCVAVWRIVRISYSFFRLLQGIPLSGLAREINGYLPKPQSQCFKWTNLVPRDPAAVSTYIELLFATSTPLAIDQRSKMRWYVSFRDRNDVKK